MTQIHAPVPRPNSEIAERAREIHPVQFSRRLLLSLITGIFVAVGWTAGRSWFFIVFSFLWVVSRLGWLGQCVRYGFHQGAKHKLVPKE